MYIHLRDKTMPIAKTMTENMSQTVRMWNEELGAENQQWEAHPEKKPSANERQVAGSHYKNMKVQPWDVIDSLPHGQAIGFYRGNALKYIIRSGEKGSAREDYEKAIHYLEKLLEILD